MQDCYQVLGIPTNATPATIKSAYRGLAKLHHPDMSDDPGSLEKMQLVNEAYEVLGNPFLKTIYDYIYYWNPAHVNVGREQATPPRPAEDTTAILTQDIIFTPTPIQRNMSGFAMFDLRCQDRLPAIFLVPMLTLMVAVTLGLWEVGAGIVFVAGGASILALIVVIIAHILGRADISLE